LGLWDRIMLDVTLLAPKKSSPLISSPVESEEITKKGITRCFDKMG
jgi:hypothetical protein